MYRLRWGGRWRIGRVKQFLGGEYRKLVVSLLPVRGEEGGVMRIIKNLTGASGKFYRDITRIIRRQTFPPPPQHLENCEIKKSKNVEASD